MNGSSIASLDVRRPGGTPPSQGLAISVPIFGGAGAPLPFQWCGLGKIVGTVKYKGDPTNVPVSRRVRLVLDREGRTIMEVWADATTGAYSFLGLSLALKYSVYVTDFQGAFRVVVADNLTPDRM